MAIIGIGDCSPQPGKPETWAEEVQRLQREIAERQARLQFLVLGDPTKAVHVPISPTPGEDDRR